MIVSNLRSLGTSNIVPDYWRDKNLGYTDDPTGSATPHCSTRRKAGGQSGLSLFVPRQRRLRDLEYWSTPSTGKYTASANSCYSPLLSPPPGRRSSKPARPRRRPDAKRRTRGSIRPRPSPESRIVIHPASPTPRAWPPEAAPA